MKKFFSKNHRVMLFIFSIGTLAYAALLVLYSLFKGFTIGQFFPILASFVIAVIGFLAIMMVPLFIFIKKEQIAKIIYLVLAGYYILSQLQARMLAGSNFIEEADKNLISYSIISFIIGFLLLAVIAFVVLSFAIKKKEQLLSHFILITGVLIIVLAMVSGVNLIISQNENYATTADILETAANSFVLPSVLLLGYIYFFYGKKEDEPELPKVEEEQQKEGDPSAEE